MNKKYTMREIDKNAYLQIMTKHVHTTYCVSNYYLQPVYVMYM